MLITAVNDARNTSASFLAGEARETVRRLVKIVRSFSHPRLGPALRAIAFDWALIIAAMTTALWRPDALVIAGAVIVIASRQHALLILMHDAAHFRLFPSFPGSDGVANWLLGFPFLMSLENYRKSHLAHHAYLGGDRDPDWIRKKDDPRWRFPKTRWQLVLLFMRDLLGGGFLDQLRSIHSFGSSASGSRPRVHGARPLFWGVSGIALAASGHALPILILWFTSAFTILPIIMRLRSISEHFGVENETDLNKSRNYVGPLWERFLFCPHNVAYHLDHHLFPSVPFHNLPRLHRFLEKHPRYRALAHQNSALFPPFQNSVIHDLVARPNAQLPLSTVLLRRTRNSLRLRAWCRLGSSRIFRPFGARIPVIAMWAGRAESLRGRTGTAATRRVS